MSDDEGLVDKIMYWFETPSPGSDEGDDIWSEFHLFSGDWIELMNRLDWYEAPRVPTLYEKHKSIMSENMDMKRPFEEYYYQNVDSNDFESHMRCEMPLPSDRGDYRIKPLIKTKSPPSGENDFAFVEYWMKLEITYDIPNGITFLPRIVARPLNWFFRWAFIAFIAEEMIERDAEYAREKLNEYVRYVRKYHGEEPTQSRTRQVEFKPMPEEGRFFE